MQNIIKSNVFRLSASSAIIVLIDYAINWRFTVAYSFVLILIDVFVFLCFIIVTFYTILWAVKNSKKYLKSYIVAILNPFAIFIIYCLPSYTTNKNYPLFTSALCKQKKSNCACNLYLQYYKVIGGGYMTTDVNSIYITDLNHFSHYIGTYDEGYENINITCIGEQIITTKTSHQFVNTYWGPPQLIKKETLILKKLIGQGKFD